MKQNILRKMVHVRSNTNMIQEVEEEEFIDEEDDGWEDGDGEPCPTCGKLYRCWTLVQSLPLSFCWI